MTFDFVIDENSDFSNLRYDQAKCTKLNESIGIVATAYYLPKTLCGATPSMGNLWAEKKNTDKHYGKSMGISFLHIQ